MRKTIRIQLPKDADLLATMRLFREIANEVSKMAWEIREQLKGKFDLRRQCYPLLRSRYTHVNSRVLEYIIRVVNGCYSKKKRRKLSEPVVFRRNFALFDKRLFKFGDGNITLWTIAGRKNFPFTFAPVKRFKEYWEKKVDVDSITLKESDRCIVGFVCLTVPEPPFKVSHHFVGIDIGAECPLVAVRDDGAIFFPDFSKFHKKRKQFLQRRRYLQSKLAAQRLLGKDAHNTIRELKRLSGKQRLFTKQFLNWVINRLFNWMGDAVIVMERLKLPQGKKVKNAKALNRTLSLMPSGIIKQVILEKAKERGLRVIFVNPAGTSQTCPKCGGKGERVSRDLFRCHVCGFSCHADIVGARNILKRGFERVVKQGAETGDEPVGPFQPLKTCPAYSAGNVEVHYSSLQKQVAVDPHDQRINLRSTATCRIFEDKTA